MNNWRLVYTIIAVHLLLVIAHAAAHLQLSIFLPSLGKTGAAYDAKLADTASVPISVQ